MDCNYYSRVIRKGPDVLGPFLMVGDRRLELRTSGM